METGEVQGVGESVEVHIFDAVHETTILRIEEAAALSEDVFCVLEVDTGIGDE